MNDTPPAILVKTGTVTEGLRGHPAVRLPVDDLSVNVNIFLEQMTRVLETAPEAAGKFRLEELEVSAEISAKGQLVLVGVGGEVGATGGIKFVFKRT